MTFLDSTVLIDYFNGKATWQVDVLDTILGLELVVIGDYVLTEVLQGFRKDNQFIEAKSVLLSFPCFDIGGKKKRSTIRGKLSLFKEKRNNSM